MITCWGGFSVLPSFPWCTLGYRKPHVTAWFAEMGGQIDTRIFHEVWCSVLAAENNGSSQENISLQSPRGDIDDGGKVVPWARCFSSSTLQENIHCGCGRQTGGHCHQPLVVPCWEWRGGLSLCSSLLDWVFCGGDPRSTLKVSLRPPSLVYWVKMSEVEVLHLKFYSCKGQYKKPCKIAWIYLAKGCTGCVSV